MKQLILILAICLFIIPANAKNKKMRTHRMKKTAPVGWVDNWYDYYQTATRRNCK